MSQQYPFQSDEFNNFWTNQSPLHRPTSAPPTLNFVPESLFAYESEEYYPNQSHFDQEQNYLAQQFSSNVNINDPLSKAKKSRSLKVRWPDEQRTSIHDIDFEENAEAHGSNNQNPFSSQQKNSKSLPNSRRTSVSKDQKPENLNLNEAKQSQNPSLLSQLMSNQTSSNNSQFLPFPQSNGSNPFSVNKFDEKLGGPYFGQPFSDPYGVNFNPNSGPMSPSIPPQFDDNFLNDDEMENSLGSPVVPSHVKKYLHKIANDRTQFPILLRRDQNQHGMLSAALDLASFPSNTNQEQGDYQPFYQNQNTKNEKNGPSKFAKNEEQQKYENETQESWENSEYTKPGFCKYFKQGFCSRGDRCKFSHTAEPQNENFNRASQQSQNNQNNQQQQQQNNQNQMNQTQNNQNQQFQQTQNQPSPQPLDDQDYRNQESPPPSPPLESKSPKKGHKRSTSAPEAPRFPPLEHLVGQIYSLCRDQHGCRYLQKKLEEGKEEHIEIIFNEIYEHLLELMSDPFGNYLCQKLFIHTTDAQRTKIAISIGEGEKNREKGLIDVSMNMHGTRSVQKLIDCMQTKEQIELIIKALRGNVVKLIKDLNGNHVIQKCLNKLSPEQNQFIYDAVTENCVEVASHRHGCCVLQRCIDHASDSQKLQLSREITKNALTLVQDAFGNYVVQYILDLNVPLYSTPLIRQFIGHVYYLSLQKFSSNVIEKCIRVAEGDTRRGLITGVIDKDKLPVMLQDSYANYVVQTSLDVADPDQHAQLAELVRPLLPAIRHLPYCKRVQSKLTRDYRQYQGNYST